MARVTKYTVRGKQMAEVFPAPAKPKAKAPAPKPTPKPKGKA